MISYLEDKVVDIFRVYIHLTDKRWIDVSTKQLVIYGAGQGCLDLMNEMPLYNISYIVDSDKNKWNKEIELLNIIYRVQRPSVLTSLNLRNYYVLISSNENEKSIKESIEAYIPKDNVLICKKQELFFCYKNLKDMICYDTIIKKKLLLTNMSFAVENIISIFENTARLFGNIRMDRFMPLREGESKLAFLFGNEMGLWVFSIPGYHNSWEKIAIDRDSKRNKRIRYEIGKRIDIDKSITVYEDESGVLIQKYAEEHIDFSKNEIRRIVLAKCHRLHQINEVVDIHNDMIDHHYSALTEKVLKRLASETKIIIKIKLKMDTVVGLLRKINYTPKICHCDLLCTNVVCYNGDLFFIDWEYMAMADPMFDVCSLLFSMGLKRRDTDGITYKIAIQNIYTMLRRDIDIYFERECTDKEYLHAFLVMLIFECRELYKDALLKRVIDIEKKEILLSHIDCIKNSDLLKIAFGREK